MLDDQPRIEAVAERDIDLLLMEEIEGERGFFEWIVSKATAWPLDGLTLVGVWHSVSNEHGESDLLVLAQHPDKGRLAVLIENKVDAPPQPEQSVRYNRRGSVGIAGGDWNEFVTCIVAPERYLGAATNAAGYQANVSYEQIKEWMLGHLPPGRRTEFRRNLLLAAIEQQRRGYSRKLDPIVTRFFEEYWEYSEALFPELRLNRTESRPADSTWATFRPEGLSKGRELHHKLPYGHVDLQLAGHGSRIEELTSLNTQLLREGLRFVKATKSAALRIQVPIMDVRQDFTEQRESALLALKAAYRLWSLMHLVRME